MSDPIPFSEFNLDTRIQDAVARLGFEQSTPIQAAAIPALLDGNDVIGRARTGSGKTAAFGLPLLEKLKDPKGKAVRGIVLCPTRELALQVTEALRSYAKYLDKMRITCIYGGASYTPQIQALKQGAPVVVGTPGRVIDLVKRGKLDLSKVESVVLDEADEMLRMGFIDDVNFIFDQLPPERQVLLFSATMPNEIRAVAEAHLNEPMEIQVESKALTRSTSSSYGYAYRTAISSRRSSDSCRAMSKVQLWSSPGPAPYVPRPPMRSRKEVSRSMRSTGT